MRKLGQFVVNFLKAEDGPTAVEHAGDVHVRRRQWPGLQAAREE
jgi:hypothetical protein